MGCLQSKKQSNTLKNTNNNNNNNNIIDLQNGNEVKDNIDGSRSNLKSQHVRLKNNFFNEDINNNNSHNNALIDFEKKLKNKEKELNESEGELNKREKELDEREDKLNKREKQLNMRENILNKREEEDIATDMKLIVKDNSKKEKKIDSQRSDIENKESIEIKVDDYKKEKKNKNKNKNKEKKVKELEELTEKIGLKKKELEELNVQCQVKDEEFNEKNNKIKKFDEEINQRKNEIEKIKEEIKIKDDELNIKKKEIKKIKEEISKLTLSKNELEKLNEELNQKRKDFENLEKKIKKKEEELNKCNDDINIRKIELVKLTEEYKKNDEKLKLKEKQLKNKSNELLLKDNNLKLKEKELNEKEKKLNAKNEPILIGLNNIGATCYMNASLQCLSNTKKLTEYFLKSYKYDPNKVMANEYYEVIKNLWNKNNNNKPYSPYSFKETLSKENPLFAGIQANDSKDLINFLIERFHQELNIVKQQNNINNNANMQDQTNENLMLKLFLEEFKENFNSPISSLIYGILETKSQCQGCNIIKFNFQVYSFLEFPLQQVNQYFFNKGIRSLFTMDGKNPDIDLYECFEYNAKIDIMTGDNQMYCNNCNKLCNAFYSSIIYSGPSYLIINLNRGKGAVYECKVIFPEQLNIFNFVTFKQGITVYQLYAVICHLGPSSMSGHFVAYCRNRIDNKWYLYNDGIVTLCTRQNQYNDGMPYILFYKALIAGDNSEF